ncbi:MAG TPA: MFS transporter [Vicinamibacterales bacterium]|nr:MFS transporter [Vicinamibacterales bacterium]
MSDRLFTPRFFTMCGFSFTVFVSLFQLLPTAPYHLIDLGGSTVVAGLFLGMLTYSSALSAPFTGSVVDRIGHRRVLIVVSLVLAGMSALYAVLPGYHWLLGLVLVHGLFWSALLSASGAYMTSTIPPSRRAEGLGYWGLASVAAIGLAPPLGFWVYRLGWTALCLELATLNLVMAFIAWRWLEGDGSHLEGDGSRSVERTGDTPALRPAGLSTGRDPSPMIEWRVLVLSLGVGLVAFGYGSLTTFSALFADKIGVRPNSLFLSSMAAAILVGRLSVGRMIDRIGHRRVMLHCFVLPPVGLLLLAFASGRISFALAAVVFGAGFGLLFPTHTAYVMTHVSATRRGAAFGAMLAAFDTGIGTGSSVLGWVISTFGFREAFGLTALLAAVAMPAFLIAEKKLGFRDRS